MEDTLRDSDESPIAGLSRIGHRSLQQRVYDEMARSLMHGVFEAGQVLRMQALADTLGVSVMPVREALARLVSENALETLPSRSVRVPEITEARLDDLLAARCLIEGRLVRLAAGKISAKTVAELRRLTEACQEAFTRPDAGTGDRTSALNHDFHFTVYRHTGSDVLLPVVRSLWLQSGPFVRRAASLYDRSFPNRGAVEHHYALIEAFERGDAPAAEAAVIADITQSFALIRADLNRSTLP